MRCTVTRFVVATRGALVLASIHLEPIHMDSLSDATSDSSQSEIDFVFGQINTEIDFIPFWIRSIIDARHDAVLGRLGDSLDGRIWLEKSFQVEGGLNLCLREFRLVLNALENGSSLKDHAPRPIGSVKHIPNTYQTRVKNLLMVKMFLFDEMMDFQTIAHRYYSNMKTQSRANLALDQEQPMRRQSPT